MLWGFPTRRLCPLGGRTTLPHFHLRFLSRDSDKPGRPRSCFVDPDALPCALRVTRHAPHRTPRQAPAGRGASPLFSRAITEDTCPQMPANSVSQEESSGHPRGPTVHLSRAGPQHRAQPPWLEGSASTCPKNPDRHHSLSFPERANPRPSPVPWCPEKQAPGGERRQDTGQWRARPSSRCLSWSWLEAPVGLSPPHLSLQHREWGATRGPMPASPSRSCLVLSPPGHCRLDQVLEPMGAKRTRPEDSSPV